MRLPSELFADHIYLEIQVINTAFCGDWATGLWNSDPVCSKVAPTCQEYVQNNPSAFEQAYWSIKELKVYQRTAGPLTPTSVSPKNPTTPSTSRLSSAKP